MKQAGEEGANLVGPSGMLTGLTKDVLETALEAEMSDHLGYDKHDPMGRNRENSRKWRRAKTGAYRGRAVQIEVPRDRDGSFEPGIVKKRQRRLNAIDDIVLSLLRQLEIRWTWAGSRCAPPVDGNSWIGLFLPVGRPW